MDFFYHGNQFMVSIDSIIIYLTERIRLCGTKYNAVSLKNNTRIASVKGT